MSPERGSYRVIVIGGGHAGVEAAWAAANLLPEPGAVALVTLDPERIGVMSCNPAIGGLAKGQLVREVDALGGVMGLAADATGIQFKVLNQSKGAAVHGPRCQSDKHAYAAAVRLLIASRPEIDVIRGTVDDLLVEDGAVRGVVVRRSQMANGQLAMRECAGGATPALPFGALPFAIAAPAVVLTTGTFMRGLMHTGESRTPGGRHGEGAAGGISACLAALDFELGRLKTGTPPRLKRGTIDWEGLQPALGDSSPTPFSELTTAPLRLAGVSSASLPEPLLPLAERFPVLAQVECRQTATTDETHTMIRENLHRAPMYSGQIGAAGPRYCPSIEDKVVRFAERESHSVFLEPESLRDDWVYCNGISTSLPADVQDRFVRAMPGCGRAEIYRYGYAVEYDMVRPHQILATGMTKRIEGLFLAGQINGTSGYEEAAAQGLVAGVNAGRVARGEGEWVVGRDQAYIGVLMDDLVTKTPVEPYRMFTSRAEHRLTLRADNASDRLTPIAADLGLLSTTALGRARLALHREREAALAYARRALGQVSGAGVPLERLVRQGRLSVPELHDRLRAVAPEGTLPRGVGATLHAEIRYSGYLRRQIAEVRRHAELERRALPIWIDYGEFTPMRTEARHALARFRPATFGQASRLEGMTPADLTLLSVLVERARRARIAGVPS